MVTIRAARVDDTAKIAFVHAESRKSIYGELMDPVDAARERGPMWKRMVADPAQVTVLAEDESQLLGFLSFRRATLEDPTIELVGLYVLPVCFGQGIANDLYQEFDVARGASASRLEVWAGNDRAQAFYRGRGWLAIEKSREGVAGRPFETWMLPATRQP